MSGARGAAGAGAPTGAQGQPPNPPQNTNDPGASGASTGPNGASGTNPPAGDDGSGATITNPEAKRYADEAAQYRKALRDAEARIAKFEADDKTRADAQLTAQQKLERDASEYQRRAFELETANQQYAVENAGLRLAPTLGITDVAGAMAIVQHEHASEIKIGADGKPENLADLLKTVIKDHPWLAGGQQGQRQPSSGGPTNPGRQAGNAGLTLDMIKAMPMRERVARIDEIKAWEKANNQTS